MPMTKTKQQRMDNMADAIASILIRQRDILKILAELQKRLDKLDAK